MSMSLVGINQMHGENVSDLDAIIAELNREYDGKLPEQALRAAQRHRAEITPRLIELIRQATHAVRAGNSCAGNGQLFALFLLTEFEAKEALPAILEAASLPGEGPFELFGDAITEDLSRMLAALAVDTPEIIEGLIVNRSLNEYVRSQAAQTYLHWVRDGRLTREEAVERLRHHLCEAIANEDADLAENVVAELVSYAPREALPEIQDAFRLGLVDSGLVGMGDVDRSIAEGQAGFRKELEWCRSTGVRDTVAELSGWAAFRDEDESSRAFRQPPDSAMTPADDWDTDREDDAFWQPDITIVNTAPKVGRNEPCPCGSGKKYKKCCGAG